MISFIQSVAAGNALRVFLEPPASARRWRLLRKVTDTFSGEDDADAILIQDGDDKPVLDTKGLVNGTLYHYRPYYFTGSAWVPGSTVTATPAATNEDLSVDALSIVRERLDLGLRVDIERGNLTHEDGHIKVLTAPPLAEDTRWPIVTVHLENDAPSERGIGEMAGMDVFDDDTDLWSEQEGWLSHTQLAIMGWSLNPDERIELRKALRRIVIANLPVFEAAGMIEIEFSQKDTEDFSTFGAPVYQTLCTFSCTAPAVVRASVGAINDVQVKHT